MRNLLKASFAVLFFCISVPSFSNDSKLCQYLNDIDPATSNKLYTLVYPANGIRPMASMFNPASVCRNMISYSNNLKKDIDSGCQYLSKDRCEGVKFDYKKTSGIVDSFLYEASLVKIKQDDISQQNQRATEIAKEENRVSIQRQKLIAELKQVEDEKKYQIEVNNQLMKNCESNFNLLKKYDVTVLGMYKNKVSDLEDAINHKKYKYALTLKNELISDGQIKSKLKVYGNEIKKCYKLDSYIDFEAEISNDLQVYMNKEASSTTTLDKHISRELLPNRINSLSENNLRELTYFSLLSVGVKNDINAIRVLSQPEVFKMVQVGLLKNDLLCAKLESVVEIDMKSQYEATCVTFRGGSKKSSYIIDSLNGVAFEF
ncbi:hypothetical protein H5185_16205 [Shewanella sp. SG44-6]|uniref:hypothetical protein n=1 Tax=Shewanella TaxID=22 RepID=UPI0016038A45|nr:hypothetical protein [Shewanella sp. SG44-6]MBB1390942.1 hypothetical protein [Shewanella sp. SG44-6]